MGSQPQLSQIVSSILAHTVPLGTISPDFMSRLHHPITDASKRTKNLKHRCRLQLPLLSDVPVPRLVLVRSSSSIVVRGWGPFAEDGWTKISVGGITMRTPKPCSRCQIPQINPTTLERRKEPRATMDTFRRVIRVCFPRLYRSARCFRGAVHIFLLESRSRTDQVKHVDARRSPSLHCGKK